MLDPNYPPPDDERKPEEARYCVFCKHWDNDKVCEACIREFRTRPMWEKKNGMA